MGPEREPDSVLSRPQCMSEQKGKEKVLVAIDRAWWEAAPGKCYKVARWELPAPCPGFKWVQLDLLSGLGAKDVRGVPAEYWKWVMVYVDEKQKKEKRD